MDNFQLCKNEISQSKLLLQFTGRHTPVKAEKVNTNSLQTSIIVTSSSKLQSMQTSQLSAVLKSEVSVSTPSSRKKSLKISEVPNVIWKPLLPRPPIPIVPAKRRLPTPPAMLSAPGTPITPQEEDSSTPPPETPSTVKSDLMPMLLEAAAHAALRDKRQERMVKNRAAAYESRKRKREEAERLTTENLEMKAHIRELQQKIAELTVENERFKQLLTRKN
ncbi:16964_t:CDS:1 [Funneliformis geosporum]|uniref:5440_t:CDS:1 n=1 Tax=Funneliformis geosporum TaxID=1117311 RepID=A0A9W4WYT7_9GLOM|nr:16964_t:CDS:1 [Funneliformis geosporum]CAI2189340.1 5440_t:CDS:1 [Funneliformis geosporum]